MRSVLERIIRLSTSHRSRSIRSGSSGPLLFRRTNPRRINIQSSRAILEDVGGDGAFKGFSCEDDGLIGGLGGGSPAGPFLGGFGGWGGDWGANRLTPSRSSFGCFSPYTT